MWIFFALAATGIILFKLGVLSVLVAVLSVAFKAAILVIAAMGLLVLFLQLRRP